MSKTISALFDTYADAAAAVDDLETMGVPSSDISIVGHGADAGAKPKAVARDAEAGAGLGAAVGGFGGLLAGLGIIAIPGVGPAVAAGWLAATLTGAIAGAFAGGAAGGLVGALTEAGVPEADAHVYAEGVRRGGTLVTAKVDDKDGEAEAALQRRAADARGRGEGWRTAGWPGFDPDRPALTGDELARERRGSVSGEGRSFAGQPGAAADVSDDRAALERAEDLADQRPVPPPIAD